MEEIYVVNIFLANLMGNVGENKQDRKLGA